jgi:glycosyltransferase involved in cell wall biosynthesis
MDLSPDKIQIGSDISVIQRSKKVTGIQRVIVETHKYLKAGLDPERYRLSGFSHDMEPSRNFLENEYLSSDPVLTSEFVDLEKVDVVLGLDINYFLNLRKFLDLKRKNEIKVIYLIYDIIPILHPEWFHTQDSKVAMRKFVQSTFLVADYIVVNSTKVKNDLINLGWTIKAEIKVIPLGAYKIPLKITILDTKRVNLLCVGTIEPRKGHSDVLAAFDILLSKNIDVELNIVGNYGWNAENIVARISQHPEFNHRLFWYSDIDDQQMEILYGKTKFAIMASYDEGFGLPLEEALAHRRVVIARDIPVFRERESTNVKFFSRSAIDLADAIIANVHTTWDSSSNVKVRSMQDFAEDLKKLIESV